MRLVFYWIGKKTVINIYQILSQRLVMVVQSLKEALKGFDMEAIKARAQFMKESPKSTEEFGMMTHRCQNCLDEGGTLVKATIENTVQGELVEVTYDLWKECDCIKKNKEQERIDQLLQSSQITFAFRKKTFDAFNLEYLPEVLRDTYRKARVYRAKYEEIKKTANNGMCLMGRPGCGKTHLLMAVVNELLDEHIEVLYFPYVQGFEEIKNDMRKEDLNKARFDKMKNVPVLFIDDLFKPPAEPTSYELKQMFNVINHRYMEKLPVLISSELSISRMCDYDEALGSRINEMCKEFRVEIKGGKELNYRLREDTI